MSKWFYVEVLCVVEKPSPAAESDEGMFWQPKPTMSLTERYLLPLLRDSWPLLVATCLAILLLHLLLRRRQSSSPVPPRSDKKARDTPDSAAKRVIESGRTGEEDDEDTTDLVDPPLHEDVPHIPFEHTRLSEEESQRRAEEFYQVMSQRRSLRYFSSDPVPRQLVETLVRTAGTAPSGAHTEPWTFVAVSEAGLKEQIRAIVEAEEEINYTKRMGKQWVADLKPFKTTWQKEYLTEAPWILLIFKQPYRPMPDGRKINHYYHEISTAISGGILLAAIQNAGLVTLTSTPLNCGPALRALLDRPTHEKLLLLLPLGYPAKDATVPGISRKPLDEILVMM
ncbi:iodotyrosine deiodinase-like isoform X2 [Eriocheir sinensis]|uniref:iodotyrosine deiodinase-like isoform X2 n=1 Tax=Eriocheir sinensis TaxID=95602 RepID=UPI0021CA7D30|nr:iodotyrosine deiodinase-like isoform X2 [Eriocheir sinensis]